MKRDTAAASRVSSASRAARPRPRESEPAAAADEASPRVGARRTVLHYMRNLPNYLRLLWGLAIDPRVSRFDKLLVAGAIAYIVMPFDLIPDFIPFFGEVDDVYFLLLALQRLVANAGRLVVLDHWMGDEADVDELNLGQALAAAAFFLPRGIRRQLRRLAGRAAEG